MTDNDSSITQKHTSLWSSIDWSFLYGREPLPRHSMGVLVVGPPHWVCMAAKQLLSRKVFGSMDTLMLAPVDGNILARDLCPSIPLAVHVILLEEPHDKEGTRRCKGLLREATLADGGSYVLRTVGCLQQGRLLLTTSLLRPVTSLKGGLIKVFYAKVWDEMLEGTLETFMRKLNFTVEVSGNVGAMDKMPNGTFKGAMGLIQRKVCQAPICCSRYLIDVCLRRHARCYGHPKIFLLK
nr:uncharacterized protein LOC128694087 [Cherax quadricarinatus]